MNFPNVKGRKMSSYWIKIKKSRNHRKVGFRTGNEWAMRIVPGKGNGQETYQNWVESLAVLLAF